MITEEEIDFQKDLETMETTIRANPIPETKDAPSIQIIILPAK